MKKFLSLGLSAIICIMAFSGCKNNTPSNEYSSLDNAEKVTEFIIETGISSSDDTNEVTEKEPVKEESSKVSFLAVGDNIMYQCNFTDARNRANEEYPGYNFMPIYEDVMPAIREADLAYVNQETVMAGESYGYSDYPMFNSPQHLGDQLVEVGFDIVNIATNHMLDKGASGLEDTIDFWQTKEEITLIGGYENEEAYLEPCIIEKNGISIALLSYTYSTNGIPLSASSEAVIPYIDYERIQEDIRRVHDLADATVVSVHWGVENSFTPTEEQKELAQMMCDEGVDVIIGTHPHVLQPIEWFNSDNGNETLCIYSLGNFVASMVKAANMVGGMATFDIVKENGKVHIENAMFEPVIHHYGPGYYNSRLYYLSDYTNDLAVLLGRDCYGIRATYDSLCKIVTDVIDKEFLPDFLKTEEE